MGSKRAEYQKKYKEKHKDKIKEYSKRYREKHEDQIKEYRKDYYKKNKDAINEYQREYGKEWREKNRERLKEYNRQYREDHREEIRINQNLTHNNVNNKDTLRRVEEREEAGKILYECDLIDIKEKYQSIKDYTGEGEEWHLLLECLQVCL